MSKERKLVLHDEEICLYDIDYECTKDGRWLRDTILYFHFRCLERKYNILFNDHYFRIFNTQITQIIQNFSFEFANEAIPHANLSQYKLIFFPLSDFNPKTQSANHYSLLYIDNRNGDMLLKHYDSSGQSNYNAAKKLIEPLSKIYNFTPTNLEKLNCSQQQNGYDCGIYVLAYIDALIENRGNHEAADNILTPSYTHNYRNQIRDYIITRAKEIEDQIKK